MVDSPRSLRMTAWSITIVVMVIAFVAWGQSLAWHIFNTSTYALFPIFGLLAFSIMWAQYMSVVLQKQSKLDGKSLTQYFKITGWLVLVAILLHPGLLVWQLWRDGAGLPPQSDLHYVAPSLKFFVVLGMINLTILVLFELRRIFGNRPWWKYFGYLVDLAVVMVFVHGLRLGTQLHSGWYRYVWLFYGITLVCGLAYIYYSRYQKRSRAT